MSNKVDFVLKWLRSAADNDTSWPVDPSEAVALIEEVVRLRAEVDRLRVLGPDTESRVTVEARAIASVMLKPVVDSWRAEVQAERAAVVAMLRAEANAFDVENSDPLQTMFRCGACMSLINAADDIEHGDHRRKEEK